MERDCIARVVCPRRSTRGSKNRTWEKKELESNSPGAPVTVHLAVDHVGCDGEEDGTRLQVVRTAECTNVTSKGTNELKRRKFRSGGGSGKIPEKAAEGARREKPRVNIWRIQVSHAGDFCCSPQSHLYTPLQTPSSRTLASVSLSSVSSNSFPSSSCSSALRLCLNVSLSCWLFSRCCSSSPSCDASAWFLSSVS